MDHPTRRLDNDAEVSLPSPSTHQLASEESDITERRCLRCGHLMVSAEIITNTRAGTFLQRSIPRSPSFGPERLESGFMVLVCTDCGYGELRVNSPEKLKE
jgi:hypothetical protein